MNRQMKWFASAAVAAFAGAALAQTASAGTIAYEGFDYTAGTAVNGQTGGSGWSSAWNGSGSATAELGSYTYPDLSSEGNKSKVGIGGSLERTIDLGSVPGLTTSGELGKDGTTIWFSFISRIGGYWGNSQAYKIGFALTDNGTQKLSIGMGTGSSNSDWVLAAGLADTTAQTAIIPSDDQASELFVGKIQFSDSGSTVNIWANPDLSGAAPSGGTQITDATFQAFNFNGIQLLMNVGTATNAATIRTDEIRIGTDFASVISNVPVPEPASLALLGLGGLAMLRRRRSQV